MKTQTKHTRLRDLVAAIRAAYILPVLLFASMQVPGGIAGAQELDFEFESDIEEKELETDRDAFTPAMTTVGFQNLVIESAYSFVDNRESHDTHSFPELLLRYGVSDWLELRFGANYEVGGGGNVVSGVEGGEEIGIGELERESRVFYGLKAQISEQDDWMPRSVFIAQGFTPTSGEETATQFVGTYGLGWELIEDIRWDSAIRYSVTGGGEDRFNQWAPSTVLRAALTERWNTHIEYFGIFTDGRDEELRQSYLSPGTHYLVTPDFEVGVRVGWGLGGDAANFFTNVGVGLRF